MSSLRWDDIRETLRIEDVEDALDLDVRQGGAEDWASCPLPDHPGLDESATNFSIHREKMVWNCFPCGEGGGLPQLVMILRDCDFADAVTWLAQFSDADVSDSTESFVKQLEGYSNRPRMEPRERRCGVLPWFQGNSCVQYERALDGLTRLLDAKWGITLATARAWHLGYDPEHERHEYTGPALIIPHFFTGELRGWQERWLSDDRPKKIPKYTNTPGFPRSNSIFGWDRINGQRHKVVVVESVMTVIRLWQESIPAVATFGGSINALQRRLLVTCARGIVYAPDEGEVGEKAVRGIVSALGDHISVEIARPTDKDKGDLADLTSAEIREVLADATPSFQV